MPEDSDQLLTRTKALLKQSRLRARKGLGQNFLIDPVALEASVSAAELTSSDLVVEIGPGLGVLTDSLAASGAKVVAIEIDPHLASVLRKRHPEPSNVTILNADVLHLDPASLFGEEAIAGYKLVANLPFYVAAPVIRHFLEASVKPRRMVVMVQKEVAQSMCAAPGRMSLLGVSVQLYGKPSIVCEVGPEGFYPSPKVASSIVRIDVYDRPAVDIEPDEFFRIVKAGFSAPRKQLRNSFANGMDIPPTQSARILEQAGIAPQRRAETLTLDEWATLCKTARTIESAERQEGQEC